MSFPLLRVYLPHPFLPELPKYIAYYYAHLRFPVIMVLMGRLRYENEKSKSVNGARPTQTRASSENPLHSPMASQVAAMSNRAAILIDQVKKYSVPGRLPVSDTAPNFTGFSSITV